MNRFLLIAAFVFGLLASPVSSLAAEGMACTMQYQPVCGAKQVQCVAAPCYPVYHTYGNSCTLAAEKGTFIHEGECTADETGPVKPAMEENYVPPANCTAWFDGCNSCSRGSDGQSMCTLMACMGPKAPGRCTAYEKPGPAVTLPAPDPAPSMPVVGATTSISASPSAEASTTAKAGFFHRMWNTLLDWFGTFSR